jgi:hypothetical protein
MGLIPGSRAEDSKARERLRAKGIVPSSALAFVFETDLSVIALELVSRAF